MKAYACAICGKEHVKLWRPYMDTQLLICATCAEERQTQKRYDERIWKETSNGYVGIPTGKKLPLAKWKVNEKGKIPSYSGPGPEGLPMEMTDALIVNLRGVSKSYSFSETMIPAVPAEDGYFWGYNSAPEECYKWWEELPTR